MSLVSEAPELFSIDGQGINIATETDLFFHIRSRLNAGRGFCLYTLNLDHLVKRRASPEYRAIFQRGTFVTADGAPIVAMARRQGVPLSLITGSDLIDPLSAMAAKENIPLYFYGSTQPVLTAAAAELLRRHPRLRIVGWEAPPFGLHPRSEEVAAAGARMARAGAKLCLLALSAPRQEAVSDFLFSRHPDIGFLGFGAGLDFVAGSQIRAPLALRRMHLEWLWRLLGNPRRLFPRYYRCALLLADIVWIDPLRRVVNPHAIHRPGG